MLEAALERGALGAKSGEGILGRYDARSIEALARRRARVLLAMSRLHADGRVDGSAAAKYASEPLAYHTLIVVPARNGHVACRRR